MSVFISFSILYRLLSESTTAVMFAKMLFSIYIIPFTFIHWHFTLRKSFFFSQVDWFMYLHPLGPLAPMSFWYIPIVHWLCSYFLEKHHVPDSFFPYSIWMHKLYIVVFISFFIFILYFSCPSPGNYDFLKKPKFE